MFTLRLWLSLKDPDRFDKFNVKLDTPCDGPLLVDFSKVGNGYVY